MRRSHRIALIALISSQAICFALVPDSRAGESDAPRLRLAMIDGPGTLENDDLARVVSGEDPRAPRALVLWRWNGREFLRVAETRSDPSGHFDFGSIAIPLGEVYLDVAARGARPSRDRMVAIEQPLPAPGVSSTSGIAGPEILIQPARFEGELRLYDAESGRLLMRSPIDPHARAPHILDLDAELGSPRPRAVMIRQRLGNGRRSPPAFWRLDQSGRPD